MGNELLISAFFILLVISCDKGFDQDKTIHVHKPKQDYSSYVPVEFSQDQKTITSAPGRIDSPIKLVQGFFMGNTMGQNTAYLSITIEEYNSHDPLLPIDSLYKYILETDPFLEYYISEDNDLRNDFGVDTLLINNLIRESNLTKYFTRLK